MALQIEEGKFYRCRNGERVGPAREVTSNGGDRIAFPWRVPSARYPSSANYVFKGNGAWAIDGSKSDFDIVAEWVDEPAVALTSEGHFRMALTPHGYMPLRTILDAAFDQSASGKGAERHANGQAFLDQPIMRIGRRRGLGFVLGQADKKSDEAQGMVERGEREAAERELLGAIVYLAASVLLIREMGGE